MIDTNHDTQYNNKFLARCYGAYFGSELIYKPPAAEPSVTIKDWHLTTAGLSFVYSTPTSHGSYCGGFLKCQLSLKPIITLLHEDAIVICKLIGIEYDNDPESENYDDPAYYSLQKLRDEIATSGDELLAGLFPMSQRLLDELRWRGYDYGYDNIPSLIEAGIAIDATK